MKRSLMARSLGVTAALALLVSGCGEAATDSTATSATSTPTTIDSAIGTQFSGGKPGKASDSQSPIKVGLINQEGGTISNPEASAAVRAAFEYINAEQGGIGGHPLQVEVCKVTSSEESAQQCAQKFLNDSSIDVVMQGGLNVGTDAVHQTLNGAKPDVIALANPGTDLSAKNAFAVNPSVIAALPGLATYAKSKGYKSIGIVSGSDAGSLSIAQTAQGILNGFGITSKVTTYPSGSTDLTSAYSAALSAKPDAIAPLDTTTAGCTATAKALQSIGSTVPIVASSLCLTDQIKTALGDFPKWAYESTVLSLYAPDETGQLDFYKAVMSKYAGKDAQLGISAPQAFGAAFLLANVLNMVGPDKVTPASVSSALAAYTGGVLLGTPKVAFGSMAERGMPTLSGTADRFYTYSGDGKWASTPWQGLPQ
ncbi:ABC transporter substrate-binding protein [Cryptosporangium aurantiacum]|uniref:Branched-chain amino acid transport system substrate-binding protein n=1 Tax=Cryptosporangium aurantiacum TaxID=134849 RepID=A0A1M7R3B8_9ACTN|nr:ABC transporter substrate-binding protein [Cryptosporangium aurantiacum]SHN39404.1 branched-chain amino acid transport system substrate-binding protein [Cryptosporangium aurantiacum]